MSGTQLQSDKKIFLNVPIRLIKKGVKICNKVDVNRELPKLIQSNKPLGALYDKLKHTVRQDVIFNSDSKKSIGLTGEYERLSLVNFHNMQTEQNRTVATYMKPLQQMVTITSDRIVKLIGQDNYNIIFLALCSVISQELKVKAILSLLMAPKENEDSLSEIHKSNQGDVLHTNTQAKHGLQRRVSNRKVPYVVKDHNPTNAIIINPNNTKTYKSNATGNVDAITQSSSNIKQTSGMAPVTNMADAAMKTSEEPVDDAEQNGSSTPLQYKMDDETCMSDFSISTDILNYNIDDSANFYDQLTCGSDRLSLDNSMGSTLINSRMITMLDGTKIQLPCEPEDELHIAVPEILDGVPRECRGPLLFHQAYLDWKYCLITNEENRLPIHDAVLYDDIPLLHRQCVVLKARKESVDIGDADKNLSALQIAIINGSSLECVKVLLSHGASPLERDDEDRTALHYAAKCRNIEYLRYLLDYCRNNAINLLEDHEIVVDNDEDPLTKLFLSISNMFDADVYNPLMVASKLGYSEHVKELLSISSEGINNAMPNSGKTALYLAVESACLEHKEKPTESCLEEKFKTIETLLEYNADPHITTFSGINMFSLTSEYAIPEMSMRIANKLTSAQNISGTIPEAKSYKDYILVKDSNGVITFPARDSKMMPGNGTEESVKRPVSDEAAKAVLLDENIKSDSTGKKLTLPSDAVDSSSKTHLVIRNNGRFNVMVAGGGGSPQVRVVKIKPGSAVKRKCMGAGQDNGKVSKP